MTLKLESNISMHVFTGYREDGRVLCEVNTFKQALNHGAKYVRNNETKRIYVYGPAGRLRLVREIVEHVTTADSGT